MQIMNSAIISNIAEIHQKRARMWKMFTKCHVSLDCITFIYMFCIISASNKDKILKSSTELLNKESERLSETINKCTFKSSIPAHLNELRVSGKHEKAIACHIKQLKENKENGWYWSSLGQCYLNIGGTKFKGMANNCFKQAAKLNDKLNSEIKEWHYLGPFVIGKNEVDGDPVQFYGRIKDVAVSRYQKKRKFYSEIVPKGEVNWEIITQKRREDYVQIQPKLNWNDLVSSLGSTGITEWQGWVVSEFVVNDNNINVIIQCLGVHTVYIDDTPITGDVYRRDSFWFSVFLSKGIHTIYIRLRAKGVQVFRCLLDTAKSNYEILSPHFIPDLWKGYLFSNYIALPISNMHATKWLRVIKTTIHSQSDGSALTCSMVDSKHFSIAPGQIKPLNLELNSETGDDLILTKCLSVDLKIKITTSDGQLIFPLTIRCRKETESFIFTFLDHDGSVQHGAAVRPINDCDNNSCPVLLTLHGTTVPAQNQADSYKRMEGNEYVFGADRAWLVAPTRHGAHNWEGPGALTALSSLDALCKIVSEKEWIRGKASSEHVIFTGHSMGGHGAWHLATHYPDKALALISLAGWIKKEEYGDSNLFFRHDISNSYVDPSVKHIMESCIAENEADRFVSNLYGIPVMTRIGADDRTIHPYFVRRMVRILKEWNINTTYVEIPHKEHWWWDTVETNDGGCVNDKQLRDFTNSHSEIPHHINHNKNDVDSHNMYAESSQENVNYTYTVVNPSFVGSFKGVRIIQQIVPFRISTLKIHLFPHAAMLFTKNVQMLVIKESDNRPVFWNERDIQVDGQHIDKMHTKMVNLESELCLQYHKGVWSASCDMKNAGRLPGNLGPARTIAEAKFVIVIGTQGEDIVTQAIQEMAVYIANLFFLTSDAYAPIIKDKELTSDIADAHNLIIIGSPSENSFALKYVELLPIILEKDVIILGDHKFDDRITGLLLLAPHSESKLALLLFGNSLEGLQDVVQLATPTIPPMTRSPFSNMVADFVITGPEFRARGPGGYLCTGFWDNDWTYNPLLSSC